MMSVARPRPTVTPTEMMAASIPKNSAELTLSSNSTQSSDEASSRRTAKPAPAKNPSTRANPISTPDSRLSNLSNRASVRASSASNRASVRASNASILASVRCCPRMMSVASPRPTVTPTEMIAASIPKNSAELTLPSVQFHASTPNYTTTTLPDCTSPPTSGPAPAPPAPCCSRSRTRPAPPAGPVPPVARTGNTESPPPTGGSYHSPRTTA